MAFFVPISRWFTSRNNTQITKNNNCDDYVNYYTKNSSQSIKKKFEKFYDRYLGFL